ncbi:MAG TPA: VIT domain-containing protein [Kofleriaceae bacterium]|nr:VIT domain-containing protein [Kofleriaceae bacterium]
MTREKDDRVLEQNVETLLHGTYDPPRIDDQARARIREALLRSSARQASHRRAFAYGAMALAAAAGGVLAIKAMSHGAGTLGAPTRDGQKVTLADGTTAILDQGATLDPLGDRRVKISGRALLDVVPGKGRFVVETDNGSLEVLGTRFVVDASAAETDAAVIRGSVRLATADGDTVLHAGELGTAIRGRAPTRGPAPRLSHLASWAALERRREEGVTGQTVRNGTLIARTTGVPMHAPWFSPDEYPLPLTSLTVDAVVDNQVARVAIDQTFHNEQPQDLEAVYRFALPADAALSRLAMYVDGTLQESAVVERMQARRVYEDLVYKRVDPALLEWTGAGKVELRVYPVPAQQDKRIILGYTQPLERLYDDYQLAVPLPTLDAAVDQVHMRVRVKGCASCEIHSPSHAISVSSDGADALVTYDRRGEKTGDSLVLDVRDASKQPRAVTKVTGGYQYLLVRAQPPLAQSAGEREHHARNWIILDDVSASRGALERKAQADVVDKLLTELDEDDQVTVMAFDVTVRENGGLQPVRAVDRRKVRAFLDRERGGVGATDLGAAFTHALKLTTGNQDDNVIVYLGDGEVTDGERTLGTLRDQLKGRATFVGIGVGDGADLPTLAALADATGGMTYTIDPADDLGWRAFDLVAAMYTARATGLGADVIGPDGKVVDGALAYLRDGQIGDGEELEVVARVPAGSNVKEILVRGLLDGHAWSQSIALADAQHPAGDPGYLPRLWAQRRIAKLLLDKLDPIAACSGDACPSADELREKHREELRKEIVALGKEFFLLSRHTSLLVLENDAMYAQYGVPRTRTTEWMPYNVPSKIPVPPKGAAPATGGDQEAILVRTPQPVFYQMNDRYAYRDAWQTTPMGGGGWGGYWDGNDLGGVALAGPMHADWTVRARREAGRGDFDGRVTLESQIQQPVSATTVPDVPAASAAAEAKTVDKFGTKDDSATFAMDEGEPVVTTGEIAGGTIGMGNYGTIGHGAGGGGMRAHTRWNAGWDNENGEGQGYGLGKSAGLRWGGAYGVLSPMSMYYPTDPRLDDLTDQVPAFFPGAYDEIAADLHATAPHAKGSIDDQAKQLLLAARANIRAGVYQWGSGPAIAVDAAGRMGWRTTTDAGLEEWNSYDGATWRRAYPELGLELVRPVGDDEPALYGAVLPLVLATPEHLARWYDVRASGHSITLTPAGTKTVTLTIDLDNDNRVVAIKAGNDAVKITWGADGPTSAQVGARSFAVSFGASLVADASVIGRPDDHDLVTIDLPMHTPAYWRNRLAQLTAGTDEWRHAEHQLLAAAASLGDYGTQWTIYQELRDHGGIATGDVALAGRGLAISTTDDQQKAALASVPAGARRIAEYLSASRRYGKEQKPGIFGAHAGTDLVGTLAQYREALALIQAGKIDTAVDALDALGERAPQLRLVATSYLSNSWSYRTPKVVKAWDALAVGRWRNLARYEAARALYSRGDYEGAAQRYAALLADVALDADPFPYDGMPMYAFQNSSRGTAGWQLAYAAWKNKVLASGDLDHVMSLAMASAQAQPGDLDRVLAKAADLADGDGDAIASVASLAMQYGQADRAAALIDHARKASPSPALDRLASAIAERQGRPADAAALLAHALEAEADEPRPLSQVRMDYNRLVALDGRVASLAAAGADRDRAIAKLENDAADWRELDPDYDAREQTVANALLAAGRDEEAMRMLSTIIERHPMEGSGWGTMAETLEREGRLDAARDAWHQAVVIDQTNPAWRVRDAQVLFALGRDKEAIAELKDVTTRKWHERWGMVVSQAQQLLSRADHK